MSKKQTTDQTSIQEQDQAQLQTPAESKSSPLAIVGIGCLFPKAGDVNEYWSNIREGVDAITDIPDSHWKPEDYFDENQKTPDMTYARRGGFIDPVDFNPLLYGMSPKNIEATDTTQLLGMVVARQALLDAGYATGKDTDDGRAFNRDRTSVIMGVTGTLELVIPLGARLGHPVWRQALADAGVDPETAEDVVERISDSYVPWQENSFPGLLGNVAAGRIANRFDLGGTNCVVDAACASSLSAIHMAALELQSGRSDMAIAGGLDTFNDIFMYMCFSKTPALSPTGNSRPFALGGDGTILGEGMGVVVLKRLDDAKRDGDKIYAVIKGIGTSSDGRGNAIYAPSAAGQVKALEDAYTQANVTPDSIELIEAHGTGTSVGDAVEAQALEQVYRKSKTDGTWCALGSVKSMIGHTKSAAGVAGMIKAVSALKHKVLPPTIKVDQPLESLQPGLAPMYINTVKRPWIANSEHPRRAALSAFGFGGSNFHCVLEEVDSNDAEIDWDGHVLLFAFSADSKAALQDQLTAIDTSQKWSEHRVFAARSCKVFDANETHRMIFVVEKNKTDIQALIQNASKMLDESASNFWQLPVGVCYASGDQSAKSDAHKTGLLFPGQGSQYVGMLRDLACQFPQFNAVLDAANTVKGEHSHGDRLSDAIYPVPIFTDAARKNQEDNLRDTRNAQAAIGAVSLAGLRILQQFGLKADVAAGHSYGELVALCAAGVIDETALHQLSQLRGKLMAEGEGDRGSMLAVSATLEDVQQLIKDADLDLVIANHNAPTQIVLSGATTQIKRALEICKQQKIQATQLPVSAAFHSSFVANAEAPFAAALADMKLGKSHMTVLANTTAAAYPQKQDKVRQLLAGQLASPVRFVEQIEKMYALGVRTFVEVGPGNRLSGLVKAILKDKLHEIQVLTLDASSGKRHGQTDLAHVIANLAVLGKSVDLSKWDANYLDTLDGLEHGKSDKKPAMTIPLSGANYQMPRNKKPVKSRDQQQTSAPPQIEENPVLPKSTSGPAINQTANTSAAAQPANKMTSAHGQDALRVTQESILALQKMQEQTAKLHQQYLQGQETAQQTIAQLLLQQQALMGLNVPAMPTTQTTEIKQETQTPVAKVAPVKLKPEAPISKHEITQAKPVAEIQETAKAAHSDHEVHSVLLEVVAEKTGYPLEMLSLDMSLDTDLGIDSIKRVEILSALQEKLPGVPTVNPEELGTFQFLQNIVEFVVAAMPKMATNSAHKITHDTPTAPAASVQINKQTIANDTLNTILLQVVADKTGYPEDMLTLDMSLDTDLGIDSIKRVEILSALQEQLPEAPMVSPEDMGNLQTLQQIVDMLGDVATSASEIDTADEAANAGINSTSLANVLLEVVADKTGYPQDMLNLDMSLDTDLGIDSIKRVEILSALQTEMPDTPAVSPEDLGNLQTLQQIVDFLSLAGGSEISEQINTAQDTASQSQQTDTVNHAELSEVMLEVVADKTGYPVDMLNLDMHLEADLGIDSIKRVEILSALQERMPDMPAVKPEDLGALQTLQQIVDHMLSSADVIYDLAVAADLDQATQKPVVAKNTTKATNHIIRQVLSAVPLNVQQEKITLADNATVWVTGDTPEFAQAICESLKQQNLNPEIVTLDAVPDKDIAGLIILVPAIPEQSFMKACFLLVQRASAALRASGKSDAAILASVTQLGGKFGVDELHGLTLASGNACPVAGGIAGLIKTADKEWPEVYCKAIDTQLIDIQNSENVDQVASKIINECLSTPAAGELLEVGIVGNDRYTLELNATEIGSDQTVAPLAAKDTVIVTGGARGVTAEIALALAATCQTNLLLLGRSELPEDEAEWLDGLTTEAAIKKAILEHSQKGTKPKAIDSACKKVFADREIRHNLQRLQATGVDFMYRAVDVQYKDAVVAAVDEARNTYGNISGFIHGAGVLADRLIEDKTEEQFSQVYATKAAGLDALLTATANDALKVMVMFSSSTGRFGRKGQCDYAVANEVLNKVAQQQASMRKDCRVVSVNWGPWDGGMVTPALKKLFAAEGVGVIPLQAGADYLMQEIAHAGPVEVVVLGATETTGRIDTPTKVKSSEEIPAVNMNVAFSQTLTVAKHTFLQAHVMNGHAVLPVAMIAEWFAHGAMHDNPGLNYHGFRNLRVFKGVTLEADNKVDLQILAGQATQEQELEIIPVELRSGKILHARAEVVLTANSLQQTSSQTKTVSGKYSQADDQIYNTGRLFHGEILQGITTIAACDAQGIKADVKAATSPITWMQKPIRSSWLADPLALDSSFQMMILWCFEQAGVGSLPTAIGEYRQFQKTFPAQGCTININVIEHTEHRALATIEFIDQNERLIARMDNYECVIDGSLEEAFSKNKLLKLSVN